ncbi:MAG: hypothetical protein Q9199_008108 [Rusavskia elegans]
MIITKIEIAGPPAKVREVLLGFDKMPDWHSGLVKKITPMSGNAENDLAVGSKLHCVMEDFTFDSVITENDSSQFQWQGPPVYYVVAGLHTFEFKPSTSTPDGTTFVQKEEYSGLLAFLMSPSLAGKKILGQFEKFNTDLKLRVESKSGY